MALFVAAAVTDIPILDTLATIAFSVWLGPGSGLIGSVLRGAAAGFISGLVTGQNPFKAALWGGLSAGLAWGIGHGTGGGLWHNGSAPFGTVGTHLAHGISQGAISQLRGGKFKAGFFGAIIGGLSPAGMMAKLNVGSLLSRTMIASVFGGLASLATGGKFEDGAMAAAFRHLFNEEVTYFDGKDGVVTRDHRDPRVPGVVSRYAQGKINGRWAENPRSYGGASGGFNRPWWDVPGNDYSGVIDYAATDAGQRDLNVLNSFLAVGGIWSSPMAVIGTSWSASQGDWDGVGLGVAGLATGIPIINYTGATHSLYQNHVSPILW